jgi:hypothetical protein
MSNGEAEDLRTGQDYDPVRWQDGKDLIFIGIILALPGVIILLAGIILVFVNLIGKIEPEAYDALMHTDMDEVMGFKKKETEPDDAIKSSFIGDDASERPQK